MAMVTKFLCRNTISNCRYIATFKYDSHPVPKPWTTPIALVVLLAAGLFGYSICLAASHQLPLSAPSSEGWSVRVEVTGPDARFWDEGRVGSPETGMFTILYTAGRPAVVTLTASYEGALPDGVQILGQTLEMDSQPGIVWEISGNTARTSVDLYRNLEPTAQPVFLSGRCTLITSDPAVQPSASFSAVLYVVRSITATAATGPGGKLPVQVYGVSLSFITNASGQTDFQYGFHALPNAYVKVEAVSGVEASPAWLTTDTDGRAQAAVWANTDAPIDESGCVVGRVQISATKDFARVRREVEVQIPYALVAGARGAALIERPGTLMEPTPIYAGQWLRPGDVVQVGGEFVASGAYLTLWLCNGQRMTLASDTALGIQAVIGRGSFDHKTSILTCHLRNLAADIWSDPRRIGRLLVYKTLGNIVDGLMGIPDPVGWAITTPGGALEQYLSEWLENSAQSEASRAQFSAEDTQLPFNPALGVAHELAFWSDGTVRVQNAGAPIRLSGPSRSTLLPSFSLAVGRWDAPGTSVSAAGLGVEIILCQERKNL